MIRHLLRCGFSKCDKLKAADYVLFTIFKNNNHVQQIFDPKQTNQKQKLELNLTAQPRRMLSDRIKFILREKVKNKEINKEIAEFFLNMINPLRGVKLDPLIRQQRFFSGKNTAQLFPLHPSCVTKFFMHKLYQQIQNQKQKLNISSSLKPLNVLYIVGTPGIGKSSSLYMLKLFHDIRLNQIIKNCPSNNSLLKSNIKLLYFHSQSEARIIIEIIRKQVQKDFGFIPEQLRKIQITKQRLQDVFYVMKKIYQEKNIHVIVIVDQINHLYNAIEGNIKQLVQNWKNIKSMLDYPLIMVSSKNNEYLQEDDPIQTIATKQGYIKIDIDKDIFPQTRLCYTVECLIFQLEKNRVQRNRVTQIVNSIKQIPLISHLAIRKAIEQSNLKDGNQELQSLKNKTPQTQSIIKNFQEKLQQSKDIQSLIDNINQIQNPLQTNSLQKNFESKIIINKQSQQHLRKNNTSLNTIMKFLQFALKKPSIIQIKVRMLLETNQNNLIQIQRRFNAYSRKIKKNGQKYQTQMLVQLSSKNFFFISPILKKNVIQDYLFFNLSHKNMELVRRRAAQFINYQSIIAYSQQYYNLRRYFIENRAGQCFQQLVCLQLSKATNQQVQLSLELSQNDKQTVYIKIKKLNILQEKLSFVQQSQQIYQQLKKYVKQSKQIHKEFIKLANQLKQNYLKFQEVVQLRKKINEGLTEYVLESKHIREEFKILFKQSKSINTKFQEFVRKSKQIDQQIVRFVKSMFQKDFQLYARTIQTGMVFDFIICTKHGKKLRILLVDTTIRVNIQQKKLNFYKKMLSNQVFERFIKLLLDKCAQKNLQLQIYYYIMRPHRIYFNVQVNKKSLGQQEMKLRDIYIQQFLKKFPNKNIKIDDYQGFLGQNIRIILQAMEGGQIRDDNINKCMRGFNQMRQYFGKKTKI